MVLAGIARDTRTNCDGRSLFACLQWRSDSCRQDLEHAVFYHFCGNPWEVFLELPNHATSVVVMYREARHCTGSEATSLSLAFVKSVRVQLCLMFSSAACGHSRLGAPLEASVTSFSHERSRVPFKSTCQFQDVRVWHTCSSNVVAEFSDFLAASSPMVTGKLGVGFASCA